MKIPCPPVIARARPDPQDLFLGGLRERGGIVEGSEKTVVKGESLVHPSLLEEHFRNQDGVGIAGPPPGQIPSSFPCTKPKALGETAGDFVPRTWELFSRKLWASSWRYKTAFCEGRGENADPKRMFDPCADENL